MLQNLFPHTGVRPRILVEKPRARALFGATADPANESKLDRFPADSAAGNRILIVSETSNQVNGVSTTIRNLTRELEERHCQVEVLHPGLFPTIPTNYPDMRVSNPVGLKNRVAEKIETFRPERIFILTEGPLGWATKDYCLKKDIPFSTSYSIKWDEYMKQHFGLPIAWTRRLLRNFHKQAASVLVITPSLLEDLKQHGFRNLVLWRQAVDTNRFRLFSEAERQKFVDAHGLSDRPRPFYLYVGRVSSEKNIETFLKADLPGTKLVVGPEGAGLSLSKLGKKYPDAVFTGPSYGEELAGYYASSDVFVFPSKADTLGLVMLEALASGLPVVGFNVTGPKDVIEPGGKTGFLAKDDADLQTKALQAWDDLQTGKITRQACRDSALQSSWPQCINTLLEHLKIHIWKPPPTETDLPDKQPQPQTSEAGKAPNPFTPIADFARKRMKIQTG